MTNIRQRNIEEDILHTPFGIDKKYYDKVSGHNIAVSRLEYSGKEREVMISYDEFEDRIEIVTIHPFKWMQKQHRIKNRRWVRI